MERALAGIASQDSFALMSTALQPNTKKRNLCITYVFPIIFIACDMALNFSWEPFGGHHLGGETTFEGVPYGFLAISSIPQASFQVRLASCQGAGLRQPEAGLT